MVPTALIQPLVPFEICIYRCIIGNGAPGIMLGFRRKDAIKAVEIGRNRCREFDPLGSQIYFVPRSSDNKDTVVLHKQSLEFSF